MEQTQHEYAGFWMRLVAAIVDSVLIGIINLIILVPFLGLVGLTAAARASNVDMESEGAGLMIALLSTYIISMLAVAVAGWLYFALMESSARGPHWGRWRSDCVSSTRMETGSASEGHRPLFWKDSFHRDIRHRLHHGRLHTAKAGPP